VFFPFGSNKSLDGGFFGNRSLSSMSFSVAALPEEDVVSDFGSGALRFFWLPICREESVTALSKEQEEEEEEEEEEEDEEEDKDAVAADELDEKDTTLILLLGTAPEGPLWAARDSANELNVEAKHFISELDKVISL
jgi:hypothetical protein